MDGYELLDVGDGWRLERFGDRAVERPHPGALGAAARNRAAADLRFEPEKGWIGAVDPWTADVDGLTLELRPTAAGQVGLFPEQGQSWTWLRQQVRARAAPEVLNLFGYTGMATLAAARAGASVVHVDASRPTVAWARRNAELSGLAHRPIRWIVDDAAAFVARELRRGRRYAGIVLDPPSYGHGRGGSGAWRIEDDLAPLLDRCGDLLDGSGFALLTAHTPGFEGDRLRWLLAAALGVGEVDVEAGPLVLTARTGRTLELGAFARWPGAAS